MSFSDRQYEVFVVLGDPKADPAWKEPQWRLIVEIFDPLIQKARDRAAVRSTQLNIGSGSPNRRAISFGRISWSDQGHKKWVHPLGPTAQGSERVFISTEVWAPSWTICEQEGRPPDVYLAVRNEQSEVGERASFNPVFIFALALDQDSQVVSRGRPSAEALAGLLHSQFRVRCVRPWGYRSGDIGFTGAIGDLCATGLFKPGPRHQRPLSLETFAGSWEAF